MHLGLGIKSKLIFTIRKVYIYVKNGFRYKTILFYPMDVYKHSMMNIIINENFYKTTNNPNDRFDIAMSWDFETYRERYPLLETFQNEKRVLNLDCLDISKTYIGNVFKEVFGYSIIVDPTSFTGKAVKKSELNAFHDGTIIQCPIESADNEFNYTKLIDSTVSENYTLDLRVLYFNGKIPFIYKRFKGLDNRFDAKNIDSKFKKTIEVRAAIDVFSKEEIDKIITFCKKVKLDYGELDVLRDNLDQKIYIVDVNPTPSHQPYEFKREERIYAYKKGARIFDEQFL